MVSRLHVRKVPHLGILPSGGPVSQFRIALIVGLMTALQTAENHKQPNPKPDEFPSLEGRNLVIQLTEKGRQAGKMDAAIADGQFASSWASKAGFPGHFPIGKPTYNGINNKTTSYNAAVTNERGDQLVLSLNVYDAQNGGHASGSLSIIKADGTVKTYALMAEGVIQPKAGNPKGDGGQPKGKEEPRRKEKR